jgi:hypothetical protein
MKTACILLVNGHAFLLDEADLREAATAPTPEPLRVGETVYPVTGRGASILCPGTVVETTGDGYTTVKWADSGVRVVYRRDEIAREGELSRANARKMMDGDA